MYEKLQELCKLNGITITNLCIDITGSPGNLGTWKKGNINPVSLVKIADYFNVSTDYLLGRTDEPNSEIHQNITAGANNSGSNNVSIGAKAEESFTEPTDSMTRKFIDVFVHLNFSQQVNVMKYALEQAEKSA